MGRVKRLYPSSAAYAGFLCAYSKSDCSFLSHQQQNPSTRYTQKADINQNLPNECANGKYTGENKCWSYKLLDYEPHNFILFHQTD